MIAVLCTSTVETSCVQDDGKHGSEGGENKQDRSGSRVEHAVVEGIVLLPI